MNINDVSLFPDGLEQFIDFADLIGMDCRESQFTLDSGFDGEAHVHRLMFHQFTPVIKPNLRRTKNKERINARLDAFDEGTYKKRFCVERTFAWEDSYRKLAQRYEILEETFRGFRFLAHTMINLRQFV